jgi:elongation factor Ts
MPDFTAKDVQEVRAATGAGMMDSKKALEETQGDKQAAMQLLREKGLAASAKRSDRENAQGAVAIFADGNVAAMVQLKCETDFVAKSDHFKGLANELAALVALKGEDAISSKAAAVEDLKVTLKENIEVGRVVRFEAPEGDIVDSYLHVQSERGVNGVLVELQGGTQALAHDIAVHIAFARPRYLHREEVPEDVVAAERRTLETITRNEGKPEAAMAKIVDGRIQGFFKDIVLVDQPFAKDDKQSVAQVLGGAKIVRYAQIEIGA